MKGAAVGPRETSSMAAGTFGPRGEFGAPVAGPQIDNFVDF